MAADSAGVPVNRLDPCEPDLLYNLESNDNIKKEKHSRVFLQLISNLIKTATQNQPTLFYKPKAIKGIENCGNLIKSEIHSTTSPLTHQSVQSQITTYDWLTAAGPQLMWMSCWGENYLHTHPNHSVTTSCTSVSNTVISFLWTIITNLTIQFE